MTKQGPSTSATALRDPAIGLIARKRQLIVVSGTTSRLEVDDSGDALELLERLIVPTKLASLGPRHRRLVDSLVAAGVVVVDGRPHGATVLRRHATRIQSRAGTFADRPVCTRLVVGATGAIHSFLFPKLLHSAFLPFAETVDVILTDGAQKFVTRHAIEAFGVRVWTDTFATHQVSVPHIELAKAQLIVVYPASAATLHRLASGACSDLLSLVVAATAAPMLVVPAMNGRMWSYAPIRRNIQALIEDGAFVVVPSLMHEVAAGFDADPIYGGAGIGAHNLAAAMASVLEHAADEGGASRTGPAARRK